MTLENFYLTRLWIPTLAVSFWLEMVYSPRASGSITSFRFACGRAATAPKRRAIAAVFIFSLFSAKNDP